MAVCCFCKSGARLRLAPDLCPALSRSFQARPNWTVGLILDPLASSLWPYCANGTSGWARVSWRVHSAHSFCGLAKVMLAMPGRGKHTNTNTHGQAMSHPEKQQGVNEQMRPQGQRDPEQEWEAYCEEVCCALLGISRKEKKKTSKEGFDCLN